MILATPASCNGSRAFFHPQCEITKKTVQRLNLDGLQVNQDSLYDAAMLYDGLFFVSSWKRFLIFSALSTVTIGKPSIEVL